MVTSFDAPTSFDALTSFDAPTPQELSIIAVITTALKIKLTFFIFTCFYFSHPI